MEVLLALGQVLGRDGDDLERMRAETMRERGWVRPPSGLVRQRRRRIARSPCPSPSRSRPPCPSRRPCRCPSRRPCRCPSRRPCLSPPPTAPTCRGTASAARPEGLLSWAWALQRLAGAHNYWLATTDADGGRPPGRGLGGLRSGGALCFSTAALSRKGRNLTRDPRCTLSPEGAVESVVVRGDARRVTEPDAVLRISAANAGEVRLGRARGEPALRRGAVQCHRPDRAGRALHHQRHPLALPGLGAGRLTRRLRPPARGSTARNIASVPCRCGHSCTVGPVAEVGQPAGRQRPGVEQLHVGPRAGGPPRPPSTRVSTMCGEQVT